jgi:large subunit ribosomal protein L4
MELDVFDREGKKVKSIEVDEQVFGLKPRRSLVHQALVAQRANQRQGSHKTKTRGEVAGSTKKLYSQKGTGRARQGSIRAPHRRGGGIVFGPRPRSYDQDLPKRMRRLAIRSVLSARAAGGDLHVIDALAMEQPKTKELQAVLDKFGLDRRTLVVTAQPEPAVKRSASNMQRVKWLPAAYLNVLDLLAHRGLLMTEDAVRVAEAYWGGERATKRRAPLPEVAAHA